MNLLKAREEIVKHLVDCCQDISTWHITGILPVGKAACISNEFCDGDHRLMEFEVNRAAFEFVILQKGN